MAETVLVQNLLEEKTGISAMLDVEGVTSAYGSQYGSVNPAGIIEPAIVAAFVSILSVQEKVILQRASLDGA